ncbi:MAG: M81 family metallopeptidase [Pseudomonas sp.]
MAKAIRIAVLHFAHETVTFLPNDTELSDFVYEGSPCKDEALLRYDPHGYMGGFVQCAREFSEVELVGIESPLFPKTGIGSGWVTHEAFEHFVGAMLQDLRARGPFDGVYMALHGAMAVRGVARPEAELARRVREVVGTHAVLGATFDPHGNEDQQFLESADLAFCVKYYPHYDMHLQGARAARTMVRSIRGDYRPTTRCIKIPVISPTVMQWTGTGPWMDLVMRALTWEARRPDVYVNVFFGFPWADTVDAGMTVQATANDNQPLADQIARDMATTIWRMRASLVNSTRILSIEEGASLALSSVRLGAKPVVIADHSDRSGYATWVLRELLRLETRRTLFAAIADGPLVQKLKASGAKAGDRFDHEVGGRVEASAGDPVRVVGTVVRTGHVHAAANSPGDWIAVAFGDGNLVIVSTYLMQVIDPGLLRAAGIDLEAFDIVVIKSRVHFRSGFHDSGFAAEIVLVEPTQPFLGTTRLDALAYRHLSLSNYYPYGADSFDICD